MYRPDPELDILAVPVGIYTMDTLLARLSALIQEPGCALAVGVNAHVINLTYLNHTFFKALIKAEVIYTDGASLQLAARLLRARLPEKLTTTGGRAGAGGEGGGTGHTEISRPQYRRNPSWLF